MRFVAPARAAVDPAVFDRPIFDGARAHVDLLRGDDWPTIATLNARLHADADRHAGERLAFVAQDRALLDDGLHYETRIRKHGRIATRERTWHDLLNALAWLVDPALKLACNRRQAGDVARVGGATRTRAQYALTHFDEAGAVVVVRDRAMLDAWDAHDWRALFVTARDAWHDGTIAVHLFGHALREHALTPHETLVAKCIAVLDERPYPVRSEAGLADRVAAVDVARHLAHGEIADAITRGDLLVDPLDLRPLPLAAIPGWHEASESPSFYETSPCLRPRRSGRVYPTPIRV